MDARELDEEQRRRLWEFALHEDNLLSQRQNLFLVAESMFAVAYTTALEAKQSGIAVILSVIALLLTVAWLYVSARHSAIVDLIQERARNALPEYRELYKGRSWRWAPIRSRTVVTFGVPVLVGILWVALLGAQLI